MARTIADIQLWYQQLYQALFEQKHRLNRLQAMSYKHCLEMLKLLPQLENHPSFQNLLFLTAHLTFVIKLPSSNAEVCIWGEAEDQFQVYIYDWSVGENGQASDEKIVSGDEIIATLERYVQKLKQPTAP